jgi:hypothetical protein
MRAFAAVLLIVCSPSIAGTDEGAVKPGKWEYTMKTAIPGVPFPLGAVTQSICLSEEEAKYGIAWVNDGEKGSCRYEQWRRSGKTTYYDMVCPENNEVSGTFEYTASGASITGRGLIKYGTSEIIQQWQGKRVGDC